MYLLAKFGGHRFYGIRDINSYIGSYMNISEKDKLTASILHIERFSKSGIRFQIPKYRTRLAGKQQQQTEQRQVQSAKCFTQTQ